MAGLMLILGAFAVFAKIAFVKGFLTDIQRCLPRKVLITLGDPDYQQFPYFIEAYRCNGVCSTSFTPKEQQCIVVTWENITGNVFDQTTQSIKPITVQNHTSCNCQCVAKAEDCSENEQFDKGNCRCACKYTDEPPSPCPERFRWNKGRCKCVCSGPVEFCNSKQIWSPEACGCICSRFAVESCKDEQKYLNASTCECVASAPKSTNPGVAGERSSEEVMDWKRIAWVMLAELIVLLLLFDLYLCCRYDKGVIHWILDKCHFSSKDAATDSKKQNNANGPNTGGVTSNGTASVDTETHNHSPSLNRCKSRESIV